MIRVCWLMNWRSAIFERLVRSYGETSSSCTLPGNDDVKLQVTWWTWSHRRDSQPFSHSKFGRWTVWNSCVIRHKVLVSWTEEDLTLVEQNFENSRSRRRVQKTQTSVTVVKKIWLKFPNLFVGQYLLLEETFQSTFEWNSVVDDWCIIHSSDFI
jgi:hypothetical protein